MCKQTETTHWTITLDISVCSMNKCKREVCSMISVSHVKCDFRLLGWSGGSENIRTTGQRRSIDPWEWHGENSTGRSVRMWEKSNWKVCVFENDINHLASPRCFVCHVNMINASQFTTVCAFLHTTETFQTCSCFNISAVQPSKRMET